MESVPASSPHTWHHNPYARNFVIECAVFPAFASILVVLRFVLRRFDRVRIGLDDWFILAGLLCVWGTSACVFHLWSHGLGVHVKMIPPHDLEVYLWTLWIYEMFYGVALFSVKLSIIYFYKRVFAITKHQKQFLLYLEIFICLWITARIVGVIFQCIPVQHFWTKARGAPGYCVNIFAFYTSLQVVNILTDTCLYVFPLPIVWSLKMSWSRKASVLFVFLCGAVVIAVAIARAITIPQIINLDTTYNNVKAGSWASLELSFAVVTPCLPIIKSLFTGWTRRVNEIKGRKSSTVNSSEKSFPSSWTGRSSEHRGKKMGNIVSSTNATATESGFDRDFEEKGIRIQHSLNVSSEVQ